MKFTSKNRTSTAYRFTVKMVNGQVAPEDQEFVSELRALIKNTNSEFSRYSSYKPQRVKLQGRGPRAEFARRDYGYSRSYDQGLPLSLAKFADVYVYDRT
jgi:hypothetical protein